MRCWFIKAKILAFLEKWEELATFGAVYHGDKIAAVSLGRASALNSALSCPD